MPSPLPPHQLFLGSFVHCASKTRLEYLHGAAVFVDGPSGCIVAIEKACTLDRARREVFARLGWRDDDQNHQVTVLDRTNAAAGKRCFFFPGFIGARGGEGWAGLAGCGTV